VRADISLQMAQLDMIDDILPTSARSPAALNRYIYYPDHLVRMPGPLPGGNLLTNILNNITTVIQEPIFKGAISGLISEPNVEARDSSLQDESVGDFVTRRLGQPLADNLVSALLHGIYAGDLYKLSARTIFPLFWHLEKISDSGIVGEIVKQMWNGEVLLPFEDVEFLMQSDQTVNIPMGIVKALAEKLEGASVYTFRKGLVSLARRLEGALRDSGNVNIKKAKVNLSYDPKTMEAVLRNQMQAGMTTWLRQYRRVSSALP
jgi:protoporphyrinogen/coproporphyrinogen III oxidase